MQKSPVIAIAVHGGASNIKSLYLTPEQEKIYRETLSEALDSGYVILRKRGSSMDAATAAVRVLENSPMFNAGKGSVFTHEGANEMDAAVMDGKTLDCGAVACVRRIKNPVEAARAVMQHSKFILLSAGGAEEFAAKHGVEMADTSYFFTPFRWEQLQKALQKDTTSLDNESRGDVWPIDETIFEKYGTVGCVALDAEGNLAAATSTGGIVNKQYHRIGDSALIGAGTYADNAACAVSCTGKGEDFIRLAIAHDIASMMRYKGLSLKTAVRRVILGKLKAVGGRGGCIAIDRHGHIEMPFTTSGMFRGKIDAKGIKVISVYKD